MMMNNYNKTRSVVVPIISWRKTSASIAVVDPTRMLLQKQQQQQQQQQQEVAAFTTRSNNNLNICWNNNNKFNNNSSSRYYTSSRRYNSTSTSSNNNKKKQFSSLALEDEDDDDNDNKIQGRRQQQYRRITKRSRITPPFPSTPFTTNSRSSNTSSNEGNTSSSSSSSLSLSSSSTLLSSSCFNCCTIAMENTHENLPPPLPEPKYSVHKRVLPSTLVELKSFQGRQLLLEALQQNTAESYWCLMEQFLNQSDPAFCGVTTLLMVLNAMDLDPNVRWRGGWRFFGNEDMLLSRCCLNPERIRRQGITMEQFSSLARCQGMKVTLKRPPAPAPAADAKDNNNNNNNDSHNSIDVFRNDIRQILTTKENDNNNSNNNNGILVVSYSREVLGQTGDGHFSPIAAYHALSDQVLILDVARFKYSPYWVSLELLYQSMQPLDEVSQKPRGWYLCYPPPNNNKTSAAAMADIERLEDRRPAHLVPLSDENRDMCPVGKIKVEFCSAGDDKEEEE